MPDEIKPGEKPTEPERGKDSQAVTVEEKVTESAEELARKLQNKIEEAARLHKKVEKFEADEEARKKATLSETERLQQERDEAVKTANELKTKQAQRDAAEKAGLPLVFADRLKGATPEELEADAKNLLESMPKGTKKPPTTPASSPADAVQANTDEERRRFLFG